MLEQQKKGKQSSLEISHAKNPDVQSTSLIFQSCSFSLYVMGFPEWKACKRGGSDEFLGDEFLSGHCWENGTTQEAPGHTFLEAHILG